MQRKMKSQGLTYVKLLKEIDLKKNHIDKRLEMARHWINVGIDWKKVIASDEKRFCKDGNDNEMSWVEDKQNRSLPNRKKERISVVG